MNKKIGLFYGSTTCYTEIAAEKIRNTIETILGAQAVTLHNIAFESLESMVNYDYLILGIPTWDYGELQEDWETHWDTINAIDFKDKKIALYGLGDQLGYPSWFQDALGYLWRKVVHLGATTVGEWPNTGYDFTNSRALSDDKSFFVGLALDFDNQSEIVDTHIYEWCKQIIKDFDFKTD